MKKAFLFVALAAILSSASAQTYTYRQELNQEITHIVVKGNCVVRVQHDTCNWVAYRGSERRDTARLVVLEGNTLTTTPAATEKTLFLHSILRTTVSSTTKTKYSLKGISPTMPTTTKTTTAAPGRAYGNIVLTKGFFWTTFSVTISGQLATPKQEEALSIPPRCLP